MGTRMYALFATPGAKPDLVMVASFKTIEEYLGGQVPRLMDSTGRVRFMVNYQTMDTPPSIKVDHWMLVEAPNDAPSLEDLGAGLLDPTLGL